MGLYLIVGRSTNQSIVSKHQLPIIIVNTEVEEIVQLIN